MFKSLYGVLLSLVSAAGVHAADISVRVVDEKGIAVDEFETMWHTANNGNSNWTRQRNGVCKDHIGKIDGVLDLIVRAPGFASRVQRYEGESLRALRDGEAKIVLERGKEVTIEALNLASPIPEDFLIESFFPDFAWRVRMMWQPVNLRGEKEPDWNMLNVQKVDDRHFAVRVSKHTGDFFLAFHHPGWLRFCEFGPFTADEVAAKGMALPMPAPAKIRVTFDPRIAEKDRPFQSAKCSVYWVPDDSGSIYYATEHGVPFDEDNAVTIADLAPGKYRIDVRTVPKDETKSTAERAIDPGRFFDSERVTLASGQSADVAFAWAPFDPQAYRGAAKSEITVVNGDGTVPAGRTIEVSWFDGHYGSLEVFKGPLPDTGIIRLSGVSAARHRSPAPFGPYSISIDEEHLGFFNLKETGDLQQVSFTVSPQAGDIAPDFELIAIGSEKRQKLSEYRGKVVLLEFWSTGCGPCQPAMQELSDLATKRPVSWIGKVALISLSTDHDLQKLRTHIASRGWNGMPHFQSIRKDGEYFSDAQKAYVVYGIPHAILIDRHGTVRWRGHPTVPTEGKTVNDRINELLK